MTTVLRTNRTYNPRAVQATDSGGWSTLRGFGTGGAGTYSWLTAQTAPGTTGITTARRKAWTTAATANADSGFEIRYNSSTYFSVLEGERLTVSIYIRSNVIKPAMLRCRVYNSTTAAGATLVQEFTGSIWVLDPNVWTRMSCTFMVPAGGKSLSVVADVVEDSTNQTTFWKVGDNLDVTGLVIELARTLYDYFDGSTAFTAPQAASWTGATNNSPSILTTTEVPAEPDDMAPVLDPWPETSSGIFACDATASGYEGVISVFGQGLPSGRGTVSRVMDDGTTEVVRGGQDVDISSGSFVLTDTEAPFDKVAKYILNFKPTQRATFHNYFRNPSFEASSTVALTWQTDSHRTLGVRQRGVPDPIFFGNNVGTVGGYTGAQVSVPPTNAERLLLYTQPDLAQLTWKPNTQYRLTGGANVVPKIYSWMQARSDPTVSSPTMTVPPARPWSDYTSMTWDDVLGYAPGEEIVTRTNRAINPRAVNTGLSDWESGLWGNGGQGMMGWDLDVSGPSGTGITTSRRKTWTTATTSNTPDVRTGLNVYANSTQYFSCDPGEQITVSVWYRHTSATAKQLELWIYPVNSESRASASAVPPTYSKVVTSAGPNIWERVSVTFTAAAGVEGFRVNPDIAVGGTNQQWAVGESLEVTGLLIETSATMDAYFDGDSAGAEWSGLPNQSTSVIGTSDGALLRGTLYVGLVDSSGALIPGASLVKIMTIESSGLRTLYNFDMVLTTPGTIPSNTYVGFFQSNGTFKGDDAPPTSATIVGSAVAGESAGIPVNLIIPTDSTIDATAIRADDWLYVAYAASAAGTPTTFSGAGWEEALPLTGSGTILSAGTLRVNRALNPRAVSTGAPGWLTTRGFGTGGAGTYTFVTGTGPSGTGVSTGIQKQWTTASTSADQTGFNVAADIANWFSVTPGETLTVSCYVRHNSSTTKDMAIYVSGYDRVAQAGSVLQSTLNATVQTVPGGGVWTRLSYTFVVPASWVGMRVVPDVRASSAGPWNVNSWLTCTALLIEAAPAPAGTYFDGSSPNSSWQIMPDSSISTLVIDPVYSGYMGVYRRQWAATDTSPVGIIPSASQTFSVLSWWVRGTDRPPTVGMVGTYVPNAPLTAPGITPLNPGRRSTIAFGRMTPNKELPVVTDATTHTNAPTSVANSSIKLVLTDNATVAAGPTPDVTISWPNTGALAGRHYNLDFDRDYYTDTGYIAGAAVQMAFDDGATPVPNLDEFERGWIFDGFLLDEIDPSWPFPGPTYFDGSTRFPDDWNGIGYTKTYPDTTSYGWDSGDQTNIWTGTPSGSASLFVGASSLGAYSSGCMLTSSDFVDGVDLCEPVFLSDPILPDLSMWMGLFRIDDLSYAPRRTLTDVLGRHAPVALSQYRSTPSTTLTLYTATLDQRKKFIELINSGRILLLRNPDPSYPENMWYISLGGVSEIRIFPDHRMPARKWSVEIIQVDRPSALLAALTGQSWERLRDEHDDWQDVRDTYTSWLNVLVAPAVSGEGATQGGALTSTSTAWEPVP